MVRRLLLASFLLAGCGARDGLTLATSTGGAEEGGGAPQVAALALGWNHSCVLLSDGSVACWGMDTGAQLGGGTATMMQPTPKLLEGAHDVRSLAGGYEHGCAVQKDGTLACWGDDSLGAVGAGTQKSSLPWTVIGSGFSAVSAGFGRTCAVRTDGSAACWGYGDHGELGNGISWSVVEPTPASVQGLADVVSIAITEWVSCALLADGSVKCWGLGPLGDGTSSDSAVPVSVLGLPGRARQIAVGAMHACALIEDGTVLCWGYGGYGELGLGPETPWSLLPVAVPGASPAIAISTGEMHTCAVLADGTARCWGNMAAELEGSYVPVPVPSVTSAVAVASGDTHDCILLASGEVQCWGENNAGQLGDGSTTKSATPVTVIRSW
ncbi:BNR repeat domain protein [Minicystis rosea]|nr:BNR repeat domain protein [Minicystis rosea]